MHRVDRMTDPDQTPVPAEHNKTPSPKGAIGYGILWLLGIPIPILLGIFLLRGCT